LRDVLKWEPEISLEDGLARTYAWIEAQVREQLSRSVREFEVVGGERQRLIA
jgi:hypothetical protein